MQQGSIDTTNDRFVSVTGGGLTIIRSIRRNGWKSSPARRP